MKKIFNLLIVSTILLTLGSCCNESCEKEGKCCKKGEEKACCEKDSTTANEVINTSVDTAK